MASHLYTRLCMCGGRPAAGRVGCFQGTGQMTQFLGTHQNRLDAKGRVSVPAAFRTALRGTDATAALVLRPSHKHPCIEAWPASAFQALAAPVDRLDTFSDEQEDFVTSLYADACPVEADKEGRIVLPDGLKAHAGLQDAVVFMGMGRIFTIWEPAAAERRRLEARERSRGFSLPGASSGTSSGTSAAGRPAGNA